MLTTPEQTNKKQTANFPRTATAHQSAINKPLKVPINTNFLEQSPRVDELLQVALKAAGYIGDDDIRNELLMVLQAFTMERINLTTEEALQVLNRAIVDVKNNYASEAINYHLRQLLEEKEA